MARVIYSNLVDNIRGSLGGLTFNNNKAGSGVRLKPVNKFSPTVIQNEYKSQFIYLSGIWNSLDVAAHDDWAGSIIGETFVNGWNESKQWSAFNRFLSVNIGRLLVGLPLILDSTVVEAIVAPSVSIYTVNNSGINVEFTTTIADANVYYLFYLSPPNRLAYLKQRTQLRLVQAQVMNGSVEIDLTSAFESAFDLVWPPASASGVFSIGLGIRVYDSTEGNWSPYYLNFAPFEAV